MAIEEDPGGCEQTLRNASLWYLNFWQFNGLRLEDLLTAGRDSLSSLKSSSPVEYGRSSKAKAAIRRGIFSVLENLPLSSEDVYLVRQTENESLILDLLPAKKEGNVRLNPSELRSSEEYPESFLKIISKARNLYDLNLSAEPSTPQKERTKIVYKMDLSDEEMFVYAKVLLDLENFPRGYVKSNHQGAKKYITFLLECLGISPQQFAFLGNRTRFLQKYKLDSFYQTLYHCHTRELFADVFPDIHPSTIVWTGRWKGEEGVANAYREIHTLIDCLNKPPREVVRRDFMQHRLQNMLIELFKGSPRKAVEFAFPGTYPDLRAKVRELKRKLKSYRKAQSAY